MLFDMKAPEAECESYSIPVMLAYQGTESGQVGKCFFLNIRKTNPWRSLASFYFLQLSP